MKERPIIFNADMVRAVLEGRKTQTRSIIKWRGLDEGLNLQFSGLRASEEPGGWVIESNSRTSSEWRCQQTPCPFGAVGDRLWVRETFAILGNEDGCAIDWNDNLIKGSGPDAARIYRASCEQKPGNYGLWSIPDDAPWKPHTENMLYAGTWVPSIHMPRWASRIALEITGVRVERMYDISEADARAEGVEQLRGGFWRHYQPGWTQHQLSARGSFITLWKSIYGEESWQANPWVWVIEFKRVEVA